MKLICIKSEKWKHFRFKIPIGSSIDIKCGSVTIKSHGTMTTQSHANPLDDDDYVDAKFRKKIGIIKRETDFNAFTNQISDNKLPIVQFLFYSLSSHSTSKQLMLYAYTHTCRYTDFQLRHHCHIYACMACPLINYNNSIIIHLEISSTRQFLVNLIQFCRFANEWINQQHQQQQQQR